MKIMRGQVSFSGFRVEPFINHAYGHRPACNMGAQVPVCGDTNFDVAALQVIGNLGAGWDDDDDASLDEDTATDGGEVSMAGSEGGGGSSQGLGAGEEGVNMSAEQDFGGPEDDGSDDSGF